MWDPPRRVPGAARDWAAPWTLLGAPWLHCGPSLAIVEASGMLIFNIIFWDFSSVPKYLETCAKENSTGSSAENSVSPG